VSLLQTCGSLFLFFAITKQITRKQGDDQTNQIFFEMVQASVKVVNLIDDGSVSDSMSGGSDDKTIPFLR